MTRRLIGWVLLIGILAGGCLYVKNTYYSPCDTVIGYKIGNIDSRFEISDATLKSDIDLATGIWAKAYGHALFNLDPKASLTLNLVYDERQALNSQIQNQEGALKGDQSSLSAKIAQYKLEVQNFNKKVQDLNNEINYWNSKGGAPPDEYNKLLSEQKNLQAEANNLNLEAKALNQQTGNYNSSVIKLNGTIDAFNSDLAVKPEEGLYDSGTNKIDIFFITNKNELVHTLAHEFGHALGLNHVKDAKAIMYAQASSTIKTTQSDLDELNGVCEKKTLLQIFSQKVKSFSNLRLGFTM